MGLKIFGWSRKSELYRKIDQIIKDDLYNAHVEVLKVKLNIQKDKNSKNEVKNMELLKQKLVRFDDVTKNLLMELTPLKSSDITSYNEIEKSIKKHRSEISDLKIPASYEKAKEILILSGQILAKLKET